MKKGRDRARVGVLIDWPESGAYHSLLLRGIDREARRLDIDLVVLATRGAEPDDPPGENPGAMVLDFLGGELFDGLIIVSGHNLIAQHPGLKGRLPMVSLTQPMEGALSILIDPAPGFEALLEHLFSFHGYRNPAYASGPAGILDADSRLALFKAAAARHGIGDIEKRIYYGNFMMKDGEGIVGHFLDRLGMEPDVIVCANDGMAIGVRQELTKRGIATPGKIALSGYDDTPVSPGYEGPFTTVRQPIESAGGLALARLAAIMKGQDTLSALPAFSTELVVRASCGCPAPLTPPAGHAPGESRPPSELLDDEACAHALAHENERLLELSFARFNRACVEDLCLCGHPELEAEIMKNLPLEGFYVTVPEGGATGDRDFSRLMIAWESGKRADLPAKGIAFPARALLPSGFPHGPRSTLVVEALGAAGHAYGFLISVYEAQGTERYEMFRARLSDSMDAVRMVKRLKETNSLLEEARARLEDLSLTDELTRLHNRRGFMALAARQIAYCRRSGEHFWILFLDLDGLKGINDAWGHGEGDMAIKTLAAALSKAFRSTDIIGRIGGDEFVVLAANAMWTSLEAIEGRLGQVMEEANLAMARPWRLAASVGGFHSEPDCALLLEEMMESADRRLYEAKRLKRQGPSAAPRREAAAS